MRGTSMHITFFRISPLSVGEGMQAYDFTENQPKCTRATPEDHRTVLRPRLPEAPCRRRARRRRRRSGACASSRRTRSAGPAGTRSPAAGCRAHLSRMDVQLAFACALLLELSAVPMRSIAPLRKLQRLYAARSARVRVSEGRGEVSLHSTSQAARLLDWPPAPP